MKSELTPNDHSHKDISDPKVSSGFGAQTSVLGRRSSNLGSDGLTGVIIRGNSYRADLLEVDLNPAIGGLERYAMASRNPNRKTSYAGISSSHLKVSLLQDELATPMKQVIQHRGFSDPEKLAQISLTKALDSKKNNNIFFADQNFARAMSNAPNGMLEGPGMVDRMINYGATVTRDESWSDYEQYLKESYGAGNGTDMSRGSNLAPGQTPKYFLFTNQIRQQAIPMDMAGGKRVSIMEYTYSKSGLPKIDEDDDDLAGVMSPIHERGESRKVRTEGKEEADALGNDRSELKNDSQVEKPRLMTHSSQFDDGGVNTEVLKDSGDWKLDDKV